MSPVLLTGWVTFIILVGVNMSKKKKTNYSGIGGQAVIEGIMMRNEDKYSLACRRPDGEIVVTVSDIKQSETNKKIKKIPFVRGIFSFVDSLSLGMDTLSASAEYFGEEEETGFDRFLAKIFGKNAEKVVMGFTMVLSMLLAIGIFLMLPYALSEILEKWLHYRALVAVAEGVIRLVIFLLYLLLVSLMKDMRRVFMYHGAEHKCINCIERGKPLTVGNVKRSSRKHRRCGTSFLVLIMVITIILFFFIRVESPVLKVLIRLAMIPVISGISYEFLRLAGKYDNFFTRLISAPGLWLQSLTTREPDKEMCEVAIKAVEAVFDWRAYLKENFGYEEETDESDEKEEKEPSAASTPKTEDNLDDKKNEESEDDIVDNKNESATIVNKEESEDDIADDKKEAVMTGNEEESDEGSEIIDELMDAIPNTDADIELIEVDLSEDETDKEESESDKG